MNKDIILINATDSLETMIESAGEYYILRSQEWGENYRWLPALKEDIETARRSLQDLKNIIEPIDEKRKPTEEQVEKLVELIKNN